MLLTKDVPTKYDATKPLSTETWLQRQRERVVDPATAPIRLPIGGGKKGVWEWLQPYVMQDEQDGETKRKYNALDVGEEGKKHESSLPLSRRSSLLISDL